MTLRLFRSVLIPAALACGVAVSTAAEPSDPLAEVVVTATLRADSLQQLPASATVLDPATLREAGTQHLQDVLGLVPNFNSASGSSRPRYFQIRGVGETDQWQGAPNPSVGFLIDGMDFSGIGMPALLFDVAQVEVLRGPQAASHGANSLAGLINLQTRAPVADPTWRAEVSGGDFFPSLLPIVAFAVGHLACLFNSMHQHVLRMSLSPNVRQHRGQCRDRQLTGKGHAEITELLR